MFSRALSNNHKEDQDQNYLQKTVRNWLLVNLLVSVLCKRRGTEAFLSFSHSI